MTARLVNGGLAVLPRITRSVMQDGIKASQTAPQFKALNLPRHHLNLILSAMNNVVNDPHGTAYRARITEPGLEMAGKTGTVQVRRISKKERETGVKKNKDLPWKERDHALFVGYAPVNNPNYAISVVVEHGGGGSSKAAPIARDILKETQARGAKGFDAQSAKTLEDEPSEGNVEG